MFSFKIVVSFIPILLKNLKQKEKIVENVFFLLINKKKKMKKKKKINYTLLF